MKKQILVFTIIILLSNSVYGAQSVIIGYSFKVDNSTYVWDVKTHTDNGNAITTPIDDNLPHIQDSIIKLSVNVPVAGNLDLSDMNTLDIIFTWFTLKIDNVEISNTVAKNFLNRILLVPTIIQVDGDREFAHTSSYSFMKDGTDKLDNGDYLYDQSGFKYHWNDYGVLLLYADTDGFVKTTIDLNEDQSELYVDPNATDEDGSDENGLQFPWIMSLFALPIFLVLKKSKKKL